MSFGTQLFRITWAAVIAVTTVIASQQRVLASDKADPIDTNRPSFMSSPLVVPRGAIQLENGTQFQGLQHGRWLYDVPETQLRLGLIKSTELQVLVPNSYLLHYPGMTNAKVSDITELGIKTHIGPDSGKYNLALIGSLNVPTGSRPVSGSGVEPVFRAPWGVNVSKNWALMGMQSLLVLNNGHNVQWQPDFLLNRSLGSKAGAFLEYGGFFTTRTKPTNIIHFGAVYKVTPHQQIDTHFGFGLNQSAPTAFVGIGYSLRFNRFCY